MGQSPHHRLHTFNVNDVLVTAGKYLVAVHSKKTIIDKMMPKPVEIVLEELLKIQEHGQKELELDFVTLNVNFLVHLLNAHFVAK